MLIKTTREAKQEANNALNPASDSFTLAAAYVRLYKAGPTPSPTSLLSDYTECDYTGYVKQIINWGPVVNETDGSITAVGATAGFLGSGTTTTNSVLGSLIVFGNDTTQLAMAEQFTNPIPIVRSGDGFGYTVTVNFGSQSPNSEGIIAS